ncbi:MAG: Darcynin 1 [Rhodobiaceae bacterium]|nr:MAG: Darcynin 1 [Rhodobiaceae bacterium]
MAIPFKRLFVRNTMEQTYTIFILVRATKAWLLLSHEERAAYAQGEFASCLAPFPTVTLRYFDAEAFTSQCSDVFMFSASSLPDYCAVMDRIRDSRLLTEPYFEFLETIMSVEDTYRGMAEKQLKVGS